MSSKNKLISQNLHLSRAVIANRNKMLAPLGLTSAQAEALIHVLILSKIQEVTAAELAESFALTHQSISGIIRRLLEKGFIRKIRSRQDCRCYALFPTEEGIKIDEMLRRHYLETQEQMCAEFTAQEIEQFSAFLERAQKNLTD